MLRPNTSPSSSLPGHLSADHCQSVILLDIVKGSLSSLRPWCSRHGQPCLFLPGNETLLETARSPCWEQEALVSPGYPCQRMISFMRYRSCFLSSGAQEAECLWPGTACCQVETRGSANPFSPSSSAGNSFYILENALPFRHKSTSF